MTQDTQSYFGDILRKLAEMSGQNEVVIDERFKEKLKSELLSQSSAFADFENPEFPEPMAQGPDIESYYADRAGNFFRKWQALIIGLPAFFVTVIAVFILRWVFFGESGPVTVFEKEYNVTFSGPFSVEERNDEFKPIVLKLAKKRNSESVRVAKKNKDKILIEVKIKDDGREEFEIVKENGEWHGKSYRFLK